MPCAAAGRWDEVGPFVAVPEGRGEPVEASGPMEGLRGPCPVQLETSASASWYESSGRLEFVISMEAERLQDLCIGCARELTVMPASQRACKTVTIYTPSPLRLMHSPSSTQKKQGDEACTHLQTGSL